MRKLIVIMLFVFGLSYGQDVKPADEQVYSTAGLDELPDYPGGLSAFYTYVQKNMRIPEVQEDINVNVYLTFVVNADGTVSDIKAMRDPGYGLAEEAVKMMAANKKIWKPGILKGKAVRARFMLPIKINIKAPEIKTNEKN